LEHYTSLSKIQAAIKEGATSCVALVDFYLSNIDKQQQLNAYNEVYAEEARAQAALIDEKISSGKAGKLAGAVVAIKDVLCYKDHGLQASSRILDGFVSQFTGTAIQRLLDEDAIIIGRLNCDEFAMGSSNENSAYGPVLNAADNARVPGGSSGGSAVAVQADTCLISLGSDTGGSVRQPAAFTGIIGLKPTYSRISRYGLIAYASSFDTIGIFSKSFENVAITLEIIAGADDFDSTVSREKVPAYSQYKKLGTPKKIAIFKEALHSDGLQVEVREATLEAMSLLEEQGHKVEQVDFPFLKYLLPTYYILTTAEASSNLSRYDGVKYGMRSPNSTNLESMYKKTRTEGFGEEVIRRIMLGTFVLSASYHDAYYTKAQRVRRLIVDKTKELLERFDFIMSPTSPTTAFKLGEHTKNPLEMYLADLFTVHASVCGLPAISVPFGTDQNKLPIGIQLQANYFEEDKLFELGDQLMEIHEKKASYA